MDVTWRYSNKHEEVLKRRKKCRENWLAQTIFTFNKTVCHIQTIYTYVIRFFKAEL